MDTRAQGGLRAPHPGCLAQCSGGDVTAKYLSPSPRAWITSRDHVTTVRAIGTGGSVTVVDSAQAIRVIAHRGASKYAPANTVEAIVEAARRGATDVEIDIQQTKDGHLLAVHDSTVGSHFISELTREAYIGMSTGEPMVPSLAEVVASAASNDLGVYLDVKQLLPGGVSEVARTIRDLDYCDRVVFSSFRADLAAEAKREAGMTTSVLFHDPGIDLNSLVLTTGCDFVHPCFDVFPEPLVVFTTEWVERARRTGAGIITWNTLAASEIASLATMGVQGICSDDPELLASTIASAQSAL